MHVLGCENVSNVWTLYSQRVDERADLGDFEICNRYNVDNTGLVCKFLFVVHELVLGLGFVLKEGCLQKLCYFIVKLFSSTLLAVFNILL